MNTKSIVSKMVLFKRMSGIPTKLFYQLLNTCTFGDMGHMADWARDYRKHKNEKPVVVIFVKGDEVPAGWMFPSHEGSVAMFVRHEHREKGLASFMAMGLATYLKAKPATLNTYNSKAARVVLSAQKRINRSKKLPQSLKTSKAA